MSLREPLVSASLALRLQTWAAVPDSLCLFFAGARYLTQAMPSTVLSISPSCKPIVNLLFRR